MISTAIPGGRLVYLKLKKHGLKNEKDILHTSYERNSDAVEACVADLLTWPAEVKAVGNDGHLQTISQIHPTGTQTWHEASIRQRFLCRSRIIGK